MNVLILGGNSDIGLAIAHLFAQAAHADIVLASRNLEALQKKAKDLEVRYGVSALAATFDVEDIDSHPGFFQSLTPAPDIVVAAFGYLGSQAHAQASYPEAKKIIATNFSGAVSILEIVAAAFEAKKGGTIIGISSVAGDRGRQSNYIYGAAKGAFTTYLSGLRNRLFKHGVAVMTVLPGFVHTKMTEGLDLPAALTVEPQALARVIYTAYRKNRDVVYPSWVWRLIMLIIVHLPEKIFKRLQL